MKSRSDLCRIAIFILLTIVAEMSLGQNLPTGSVTSTTYYSAPNGITQVNAFGTCENVVNASSDNYFIPANTLEEWNSFLIPAGNGSLPGISLQPCAAPPVAVNCVGAWGACAGPLKTYAISVSASNGGVACPFANGATQACTCTNIVTQTTLGPAYAISTLGGMGVVCRVTYGFGIPGLRCVSGYNRCHVRTPQGLCIIAKCNVCAVSTTQQVCQ